MVQSINDISDVLAHIAVDIVRTAQKFRCLIGQVCSYNTIDDAFFYGLIEFLQTIGEKTKGCHNEDSLCFTLL